jgi:hypothetical protein
MGYAAIPIRNSQSVEHKPHIPPWVRKPRGHGRECHGTRRARVLLRIQRGRKVKLISRSAQQG